MDWNVSNLLDVSSAPKHLSEYTPVCRPDSLFAMGSHTPLDRSIDRAFYHYPRTFETKV